MLTKIVFSFFTGSKRKENINETRQTRTTSDEESDEGSTDVEKKQSKL